MKTSSTLFFFFLSPIALATATEPPLAITNRDPLNTTTQDAYEEDLPPILEKRKACSGNRLQTDVCQGNLIARMNSFHNCYRASGRCCARNKNKDYGIAVTNSAQGPEDCGYCYTGGCKAENP